MNRAIPTLAMACFSLVVNAQMKNKIKYPETRKDTITDIYFGTTVADPYRWLEDDRSTETAAWVTAENKVTNNYLEQIPYREKIRKQFEKLWNYEKISAPTKRGRYTYYYKNDGLQNQSVMYRKDEKGKEEVFLDPNTFSKDGTTSLSMVRFSKDGSLAAYMVSEGGSDWSNIITIDAETKKPTGDNIDNVKFSNIAWKGTDGFYYSTYDKPEGSLLSAKTDTHFLYYHKLGTPQADDIIVFGNQEKWRYVGGGTTEDERFLIITAANATYGNQLYIKDLSQKNATIICAVDNYESESTVIDNRGNVLYIATDYKAPNRRVVTVNSAAPEQINWKDFIAETDNVLSASTGGGYIFASYQKDAISVVEQYDYYGNKVRDVKLPGLGTAGGFSGREDDSPLYYSFTNYITPATIYAYNPETGKSTLYQRPKIDFNPDDYISEQVFYTSKDGTKVPMIITYKKGTKLNGKNPTMLYGYGGFNISLTPGFSINNAVWLQNGGIYAVPNLRGGGEYGKKWHDAGTKMQKQNVFDDFIAAAEYLIKNKYTSTDFLAIRGGSNGGLLVGAAMTQRPELFKVALPAVGVMDMLRYHTFTAGAGWAYDYGTVNDSKEMFEYLKGYSPVQNIKSGVKYPATLVTTGDHDDRVVPAHSFKFAATLQENQAGDAPVLIRIETNAGHGAGKSTAQSIAELTDVLSFTLYNMGMKL